MCCGLGGSGMSQRHGVEILNGIYFQDFSASLLGQCNHRHGCSVAAKSTDKFYHMYVIKQHLCGFFLASFPAVSLIAPTSFFFLRVWAAILYWNWSKKMPSQDLCRSYITSVNLDRCLDTYSLDLHMVCPDAWHFELMLQKTLCTYYSIKTWLKC